MDKKPNVVVLCGSMDPGSYTHATLKIMEKLFWRSGVQTRFVCVMDHQLPLFDPSLQAYPEEARHIREWIRSADGIVVGSPEYHGGCSGAMKNLLDHMDIPDFRGKPVALICIAGKKGGINTLNGLRLIFRALSAPVIVEQAVIGKEDFDEQRKLRDRDALVRLLQVSEGLLREVRRNINSAPSYAGDAPLAESITASEEVH